jgi:hypothetical protein
MEDPSPVSRYRAIHPLPDGERNKSRRPRSLLPVAEKVARIAG